MLKVHTRNLGNVAVLCLQGRIVNGETAALRDAVRTQKQVSAIVLDLARVSAIDAGGLGMLLQLRERAESSGIRFKLMNVSRFVSQVMEMTRLDSVFEIIPRIESSPALSHARPAQAMGLASCA